MSRNLICNWPPAHQPRNENFRKLQKQKSKQKIAITTGKEAPNELPNHRIKFNPPALSIQAVRLVILTQNRIPSINFKFQHLLNDEP